MTVQGGLRNGSAGRKKRPVMPHTRCAVLICICVLFTSVRKTCSAHVCKSCGVHVCKTCGVHVCKTCSAHVCKTCSAHVCKTCGARV